MRFIAVNRTGKTMHLWLDHNVAGELELTVSLHPPAKRALVAYVLSTSDPLHVPRITEGTEFRIRNPDRLMLSGKHDEGSGQFVFHIKGFMQ